MEEEEEGEEGEEEKEGEEKYIHVYIKYITEDACPGLLIL